jgi:hypothetical protein
MLAVLRDFRQDKYIAKYAIVPGAAKEVQQIAEEIEAERWHEGCG